MSLRSSQRLPSIGSWSRMDSAGTSRSLMRTDGRLQRSHNQRWRYLFAPAAAAEAVAAVCTALAPVGRGEGAAAKAERPMRAERPRARGALIVVSGKAVGQTAREGVQGRGLAEGGCMQAVIAVVARQRGQQKQQQRQALAAGQSRRREQSAGVGGSWEMMQHSLARVRPACASRARVRPHHDPALIPVLGAFDHGVSPPRVHTTSQRDAVAFGRVCRHRRLRRRQRRFLDVRVAKLLEVSCVRPLEGGRTR